ncbi:MAG: 50S ribosomal protein L4 [Clostridia bacterium]|nr:50S ribosomal protein L4 [Clostridia bacterium]
MPNVAMYNMSGESVGTIDLSDVVFGQEINKVAVHEVIKNYLANQRQGTQSTKTRTEVSGGGKKPWRQKGTGRARQGSTRAPQWTGGGVALGPKPRDYRYTLNRKLRKIALKSALSSKVEDSTIVVVDNIELEAIKTKAVADMIAKLPVEGTALIVTADKNENVYKSAKNISGVDTTFVGQMNVYDLLKYEYMVVSKDAVAKIEEVYA